MFGFGEKKRTNHFDFGLLKADMHSHLIPGIDDGSPDMEASLFLVTQLAELGYKKLITTPHIMWDMYKNTKQTILEECALLKKAVADEGINVEIEAAAEYFLDDHVKELLNTSEPLLTISQNMVLVEFSLAHEPMDLKELLFEMQLQGYQPVIAHPERYLYPEKGRDFFHELKDAGYLLQLNILSLAGFYGKEVMKQAQYIAGKNMYDLAGTDLHDYRYLHALFDPALIAPLKKLLAGGKIRNEML
jgi:protein-tyrosine phosphatase